MFLCLLAKNYSLPFLQEIDTKILQFMVEHTNKNMTVVMNILTFFGTIGGVTLILILMILISRFQKEMLLYSVLVLFTYLLNGFMKNIVMRPRPNKKGCFKELYYCFFMYSAFLYRNQPYVSKSTLFYRHFGRLVCCRYIPMYPLFLFSFYNR